MDHRRESNGQSLKPLTQAGELSRRAMVVGTVATTAVATVLPLSKSAHADAPNRKSPQDMMAFLVLSAALTGLHLVSLAPEFSLDKTKDILDQDPAVDPIDIKSAYFAWINANDPTSSLGKLLEIARNNSQSPDDIIAKVNGSADDLKFLARSIVLLWYLGSWYKPEDLKSKAASPGVRAAVSSEVVSPKAYTQGLVWQIAGAHPMGYSNLQFGYWSRDPKDPSNSADIISPTIP